MARGFAVRALLRTGAVLLFLAALVPGFVGLSMPCYMPARLFGRRRAPVAAECRRILAGYRDRGVIRPETYERLVGVLDIDLTTLD